MRRPLASAVSRAAGRGLVVALALAGLAGASPCPRDGPDGLADAPDDGLSGAAPDTLSGAAPDHAAPILRRRCATPCGADGRLCCAAGEACATLAGSVASCLASGVPYAWYTTTWTETRTYTSTVMTHWAPPPQPTAGVDCQPQAPEQQACGAICCAGWQTCAFAGQCSLRPGYVEPSTVVVTSDGRVTTRYSAPFRVTGTTTTVLTGGGPGAAPSAAPARPTASASASSSAPADGAGLSPGAIAGIVIGTLAGVALLLLLCFCCIARGLWNALFGRSAARRPPRDRERVDVYEERYAAHRGSRPPPPGSGPKDRHAGWFGGAARRPARREKRAASDGRWWLGLAGVAGALLALLNLRRDKRPHPRKPPPSRYSASYYTYSDATASPTGSSTSGRRTTYTRRTGESRAADSRAGESRAARSHYSRSSRRP